MARLGRCVHSPETSFDCIIDQISTAFFLPGCAVDENWDGGGDSALSWMQAVLFPHLADSSSHLFLEMNGIKGS
jgi:hypothetical protein